MSVGAAIKNSRLFLQSPGGQKVSRGSRLVWGRSRRQRVCPAPAPGILGQKNELHHLWTPELAGCAPELEFLEVALGFPGLGTHHLSLSLPLLWAGCLSFVPLSCLLVSQLPASFPVWTLVSQDRTRSQYLSAPIHSLGLSVLPPGGPQED